MARRRPSIHVPTIRPRRSSPRIRVATRVHGDVQSEHGSNRAGAWAEVYALVRKVPRGRVMTYGQIASLLVQRLSPRAVGWALHGCPKSVPWQRVVNAQGGCSTDRLPDFPMGMQRALLEAEGLEFRSGGGLDLERYRWSPTVRVRATPRPRRRNAKI